MFIKYLYQRYVIYVSFSFPVRLLDVKSNIFQKINVSKGLTRIERFLKMTFKKQKSGTTKTT